MIVTPPKLDVSPYELAMLAATLDPEMAASDPSQAISLAYELLNLCTVALKPDA